MTPSSDIKLYASSDLPPPSPNNVRGWLLGVHDCPLQQANYESTKISTSAPERRTSLSSEGSVDLDDLIKANYTSDVDDETDLPDLANLDLDDDSKEDFWVMDREISDYHAMPKEYTLEKPEKEDDNNSNDDDDDYNTYLHNAHLDPPELSWSPPETSSSTHYNSNNNNNISLNRATRSGSIHSDSSLNVSPVNHHYTRYSMTPMIYPSDSTSTSSRTASRLSNYSASSQASSNTTATTGTVKSSLPRKATTPSSRSHEEHHLLPQPKARSSKLAQRASHIPSPSTASSTSRLQSISSSKSTGGSTRPSSRLATPRKTPTRSSHIPSISEHSPSPVRNTVFREATTSSGGLRSSRPTTSATRADTRSSSRIGVRKV